MVEVGDGQELLSLQQLDTQHQQQQLQDEKRANKCELQQVRAKEDSDVDADNDIAEFDAEELEESIKDVKIATIGNVDAGKSTLVGVLTRSMLDDGRGKARALVFNSGTKGHEAQNGRTSCVATEIMGWRKDGEQIVSERSAAASTAAKNAVWQEIATESEKVVTFIDLCGHEGYLKTTIFGLIGLCPDYAMIVVNANAGFQKMTREHLGIALALRIPIIVVVTKIDVTPENVYADNMEFLTKLLKSKAVGRPPVYVKSEGDITTVSQSGAMDRVCPIFCVSNVTGEGLPLLRLFLQRMPSRLYDSGLFKPPSEPVEFHIDHVFTVPGVGIVVSGLVRSGQVRPNQQLLLGPDKTGGFHLCRIKTIHRHRVPVDHVDSGQACSFAITSMVKKEQLKKTSFRKGMVLVDPSLKPKASWEFKVEVVILHHATTIREGYEPVIHCGVIRQSAKVKHLSEELIRTGDKAIVSFRFKCHPEYLTPGAVLLFREGRTKGLGRIIDLESS